MESITSHLISVAKGELPADLILANARVINVFSGEIEAGNIAIYGDRIAGVGEYHRAKKILDLGGRYIAPGLINGHIHPESSMLDIGQYARAVIPHGTTTLITDLHEIANVCGLEGIKYILDYARRLPFDLFLMAPSCVPATNLETSGASLSPEDIRQLLKRKDCLGLGEVMNFPGVINGDETVLKKISLAKGRIIDGHAPGVTGKNLSAYIAAGIHSDHESVSLDEAREKLEQGMTIMIREGSSEKNLEALLPLVTDKTYNRCLFVVDDRSCLDLLRDGLGAVAPGYMANLIVLSDLTQLQIEMVFYQGNMVAQEGKPLFTPPQAGGGLSDTVNIKPFNIEALRLPASGEAMPIIEIVPGQIITRKRMEKINVIPDLERDILKLVVVERHKATGNIGIGLVSGFGLKRGGLASSIAHDSHNIIAVGTSDEDIFTAIKEIEKLKGGLVATAGGKVLASLALPIAGLLSDQPLEVVVSKLERLDKIAAELGTRLTSPFPTLSFLALPVIPEIRLTDRGVVEL